MGPEKGIFDRQDLNANTSIENKEEEKIIVDAEEARRQFCDFWKKDNSPEALKKEIEDMEFKRYQEDFWTQYLLRNKRKRNKDCNANKLILISGNLDKQNELSEIANSSGVKVSSRRHSGEYAIHTDLKNHIAENTKRIWGDKNGYSPEAYALDVAWLKVAANFKDNYNESRNNPIMASDIVVLQGKDIFEKSEDEKEAIETLMELSGKEVIVSCGLCLYTKTKSGKEFPVCDGVNFTIKLCDFSEPEAAEYIENMKQQGKDILNIAGVIDYSDPEAQKLIDKGQAIRVEPLIQVDNNRKEVLISSEILPKLYDYLKGMPRELIKQMLDRLQALEALEED